MARQTQAVEVNKFNAGLITDASPLTSPDNSSLDEDNMVLNIDGSRNRRLGMDYEDGYSIITTTVGTAESNNIGITTFRWNNAGGDPEASLLVVQIGTEVKVFDLAVEPISDHLLFTYNFSTASSTQDFSYAVVDGILVIATGLKDVYRIEYDAPSTFTVSSGRLLIRDLFGVEDIINGVDLTRSSDVQNRPPTLTHEHVYNLRNQSWGLPRINANNDFQYDDPITEFAVITSPTAYPANSDSVTEALYPDPNDSDGRTKDRFFARDLYQNPIGSTRAALGYFIIDALDRGSSRLSEDAKNRARYPELDYTVTVLPTDETPSGATTIAEYAGRVFYAGFPGTVIDGDSKSPRMSSYILFSKVVDTVDDTLVCYQEGDPTSKNNPDIIDTDGGFIRLNGAYGIQKLVNLGQSLMVVAQNGVWRVVGGTDNGFTATSYIVEKITDRGCTSPDSIVQVNNTLMFWADDAIYHVTTDQFGTWVCNNISFGRIQRLYDNINIESKRNSKGSYDSYERKVRWIYNSHTTNQELVRELVFDIQLTAYYTNTIKQISGQVYPRPSAIYAGLPYSITTGSTDVVVGSDIVTVGGETVVVSYDEQTGVNQRELGYLIITSISPVVTYTFGKYTNSSFRDWFTYDGVGVDADAFCITSYLSGGDFQRGKQVMYITTHLKRTETGYDANMNPINPSSCLVQARWGWADSDNSGKWGREFQAYRYRRLHLPQNSADLYDNGFLTITSRSKLRGSGRVLSLRFRTEPDKDLHLYGWSLIFSIEENV